MPIDLLSKPKDLLSQTDNSASATDLLEDAKPSSVSNFVDATSPMERATSFAVGGPITAAGGATNAENQIPLVMGSLGGLGGGMLGHPNLGLGLGTSTGELMKQSIKKLQGEGDDIEVGDALIMGGLASAGGKIFETALKTVGLSTQLIPERARAKLFDKALQAVNVGKKQLSRNWDKAVNGIVAKNPDATVNLRPVMQQLADQVAGLDETLIPQLKSAVSKNPRLLKAVENPDEAIALSLKEALELKNAVTSATNTILKKAVKGKTLPSERIALDVVSKFDDLITEKFPQMAQVRAAYKAGRNAFDLARPLVEPGKSVEESILSKPQGVFGLGGSQFFGSTQGRLAAKDIMSKTMAGAKLFDSLKAAHNLNRAVDAVGRLGEIAVGGAVIKKLTEREE